MATSYAVYVDTVEEKSVEAIRLKPSFRPIFEVATTRGGSGVVLTNETARTPTGPGGLNRRVLPVIALCVPNGALAVRWPKPSAHCFPHHIHALFPD